MRSLLRVSRVTRTPDAEECRSVHENSNPYRNEGRTKATLRPKQLPEHSARSPCPGFIPPNKGFKVHKVGVRLVGLSSSCGRRLWVIQPADCLPSRPDALA